MRIKTRRRPRKIHSRKSGAVAKKLSKKIKRRRILWQGGSGNNNNDVTTRTVSVYTNKADGATCVLSSVGTSVTGSPGVASGPVAALAVTGNTTPVTSVTPPVTGASTPGATASPTPGATASPTPGATASPTGATASPASPAGAGATTPAGAGATTPAGAPVDNTTNDGPKNIDSHYTNISLIQFKNKSKNTFINPKLAKFKERNGDDNYTNSTAIIIVEIIRNLLNMNIFKYEDISTEAVFLQNFEDINNISSEVSKKCNADDFDCLISEITQLLELKTLLNVTTIDIIEMYRNNSRDINTIAGSVLKDQKLTDQNNQIFKDSIIKQNNIPEPNKIAIILSFCEIRKAIPNIPINVLTTQIRLFDNDTTENLKDYIRNFFLLVYNTVLVGNPPGNYGGILDILRNNNATSEMLDLLQKSEIFKNLRILPPIPLMQLLLNISGKIVVSNETEKVQTMKIIYELLISRIIRDGLQNQTEITDEKFNNIISAITKAKQILQFTGNAEVTKQIALIVVLLLKYPQDVTENSIRDYVSTQTKNSRVIDIQNKFINSLPAKIKSREYNIFAQN